MAMTERENHDLEVFFREARQSAAQPSDALMARILADAAEAVPRAAAPAPTRTGSAAGGVSWLARLLGGWSAVGGLATATVAGLWIGYAGLADPASLSGGLIGAAETPATIDLMPEAYGIAMLAEAEG